MTRTQILYAWKELAPTDDESTIDALVSIAAKITGVDANFVAVGRCELEKIVREIKNATSDMRSAINDIDDAEHAADCAIASLGDLLNK